MYSLGFLFPSIHHSLLLISIALVYFIPFSTVIGLTHTCEIITRRLHGTIKLLRISMITSFSFGFSREARRKVQKSYTIADS